jgi:hypothetical protein
MVQVLQVEAVFFMERTHCQSSSVWANIEF